MGMDLGMRVARELEEWQRLGLVLDRGGTLALVEDWQICPQCQHCEKANRPTRNNFICLKCGFAAPADKVGAMNVKAWGSAGTHLPTLKEKKTRPALISRKPKERKQDASINPPESAASG